MVYKINYSMLIFFPLMMTWCTTLLAQNKGTLLIENVKIFDGRNVLDKADLLIENGLIKKIGSPIKIGEVDRIDGEGKTIIPGLVNAHVHAWIPYHLENAFEAGVYTLFDMHGPSESLSEMKKYRLEEGYASLFAAGYAATVQGGHGTQYGFEVPIIGPDRSPEQYIAESIDRGVDYIKILYEPSRNTLTLNQVQEIIDLAHKNDLLAVAHISNIEDAQKLVGMGIDGLVHLWKDGPLSEDFLDEITEKEVFIIPTISVIKGIIEYYEEEGIVHQISPLDTLLNDIKRLSDAGVRILAGTDPPNLMFDYGTSLYDELELLVRAGISPTEVLKTATSVPGGSFQVESLGIIEIGSPATFLMIDGDPTTDIRDVRNIHTKWVNGKIINN